MKIKSVRPLINIKRGWLQWDILKSRHVYENTYISMAKCDLELYQLDLNQTFANEVERRYLYGETKRFWDERQWG